jgi:hypothetical protein
VALSFVRCLKWWRVTGEKDSRKGKDIGIGAIVKYKYGAESDQAVNEWKIQLSESCKPLI